MDKKKSKPVLIGIAVICLVAAGIFFYVSMRAGESGTPESVPIICAACGYTGEIPTKSYREQVSRQGPGSAFDASSMPQVKCPGCGENAARAGVKCSGCGTIFAIDYVRNPQMKCPKCGQSNNRE